MSYQEKKALSGIVTVLLMVLGYGAYTFVRYSAGNIKTNDLKFWIVSELIFIAGAAVVTFIIQIILGISTNFISHGVENKSKLSAIQRIRVELIEDERDRLISLKTLKISYAFTGVGFIAAMITILAGFSASVMVNIMFFSVCFGGLLEGIAILYYYKVGITNA